MDKLKIELRARKLHIELWDRRKEIWPEREPSYFEVLDPELAANHLGIHYAVHESLGKFGSGKEQFEVAGSIDRRRNLIAISRKFNIKVMRFTAAHEIGHWLLHPSEHMHRDRPIKGLEASFQSRLAPEAEADYFAACFLMPGKLVTRSFERIFGKKFEINEAIAFQLSPNDQNAVLYPRQDSLSRELTLANARVFNGIHFTSLADQFMVSPTTMAIRIKELNLTRWP